MEMDTLPFNNYNMENGKPIFTTATETQGTSTTLASFTSNSSTLSSSHGSGFSPMAPPFQSRVGNDLLTLISQQEPRQADPAPSTAELDDAFMNLRLGQNIIFDDTTQPAAQNYFMGGNRSESVSSLHSTIWNASETPGPSTASARNGEMIDTFDFLIKSISSANNYVSMLTREQLHVLRSIRPNVLYEFLQEVAKVRNEKRMRRALPNECAFCKNNGENEECYSSHALKDWRGRVLCPVLRAFRCPRCGATGDHAHTIKYCSQNADGGLDRAGSLSSRRRMSASLVMGRSVSSLAPTPTPSLAPSPSPSAPSSSAPLSHAAIWSSFSMN